MQSPLLPQRVVPLCACTRSAQAFPSPVSFDPFLPSVLTHRLQSTAQSQSRFQHAGPDHLNAFLHLPDFPYLPGMSAMNRSIFLLTGILLSMPPPVPL